MEKILTELLVKLLDYLSKDQRNSELVEIDFSEEIKKLIIDKLDKITSSDKINDLKNHVVDCSWGTYIIGVEWKSSIKELCLECEEGRWPIVHIKYGGNIVIKPLEIQKYLNNTQYGNIFLY